MNGVICLIGESASGKSTIQKLLLAKNPQYQRVVTYTTRPIRPGEKDGVDYYFISKEDFFKKKKSGFFIETSTFRDWYYGISKESLVDNSIIVLHPAAFREVKRHNIPTVSIYINVDRRSRLIKMLERGDDIEECYRRNLTDVGFFESIEKEVDYVIRNDRYIYSADYICERIMYLLSEFND